MYRIEQQISISEFISPFGKLNPENRWVKMANMIPWRKYESEYAMQFSEDNGAPAIPFRMALGTVLLKQSTHHSDEELLLNITENPYMQYMIGLTEYTDQAPFCASSITNFRKYISQELIDRINEEMFSSKGPDRGGKNRFGDNDKAAEETTNNKGEMLLDATCAPADITYPTDVNLLNTAREKLEVTIDTLHKYTKTKKKPRTYREKARRQYLIFVKNRNPSKKAVRKAIGQQLRYVRRDLRHVDEQLREVPIEVLTKRQREELETIRILYGQQEEMYRTGKHSTKDRIVSITQPWVRPIVRGKAKSEVEFGAKVSISIVNGYAFVDKSGWDAYSEAELLIPSVERYREKHGFYPEAVIADKLYRNRKNLTYCKERGIRLSGPRLGRPKEELDKQIKRQERQDASKRNAVEGKFGEGKTRYGLDRIMARLQETSETVISLVFLCMNIKRRLRVLLSFLFIFAKYRAKHENGVLQMI
jgi:hypothetical protein